MLNFASNFWCVEYKDTRGIDAIATRMQNGKKSCRVFEEYLRDRCKCEEEHCRRLLKCVQVSEVNAVTGTLKSGFVALISSVQKTIDLHSEKANAYHRAAQEISQFRQRQKMEIDAFLKSINETHEKFRKHHESCQSANARYLKCCKDAESLRMQVGLNQKCNSSAPSREQEKLETKAERARQSAEQAESAYKNAVQTLEESRVAFIAEFSRAANAFELLEQERIKQLRNAMWVATNVESKTDVDDDKLQEEVRLVLQGCEFQADLQQFVAEKRTGSEPPAPVPFEDFRTKEKQFPRSASASTSSGVASASSTMPHEGNSPALLPPNDELHYASITVTEGYSNAHSVPRHVEPVYSEPFPKDQRLTSKTVVDAFASADLNYASTQSTSQSADGFSDGQLQYESRHPYETILVSSSSVIGDAVDAARVSDAEVRF